MAHNFKLFNTLHRKLEDFTPINPGKINLYVCGMTVYDHAHVGHGRAMVVFDAFVRYLRYRGWDVNFVRNFTDVDDKIIARAKVSNEEPSELALRYIKAFQKDANDLGLIEPTSEPKVSESIPQIIELISDLISNGHAYVAKNSVWFQVKSFPEYGKLSGQKVDELRSADDAEGKSHPADFALWKAVKPGEPAWDSPWGKGRPGWHIECSAMSKATLGPQIDIHGGGLDLIFPHHENEIAQSECANKQHYVNYWMHNGLLTMKGGQKMGKSLGNVINIRDAITEYPAEAIRYYLLQNHYRSPLPWSATALNEALRDLNRLYEAKEVALQMKGQEKPEDVAKALGESAQKVLELGKNYTEKMHKALDEDFNTSLLLGHTFELARAINRFAEHKKAKKRGGPVVAFALDGLKKLEQAIGFLGFEPETFHLEVKEKRLKAMGLNRQDIEQAIERRSQARATKQWDVSDSIRNELSQQGVLLMDTPSGVEWRLRI